MTDAVSHIYRRVPPWRVSDPLTECGRRPTEVADVITFDAAKKRVEREGQMRAAYTFCMTCVSRSRGHNNTWDGWEQDPARLLSRDLSGKDHDTVKAELHALAALVAAHPEEFKALLSAGNDLAERRAMKNRR